MVFSLFIIGGVSDEHDFIDPKHYLLNVFLLLLRVLLLFFYFFYLIVFIIFHFLYFFIFIIIISYIIMVMMAGASDEREGVWVPPHPPPRPPAGIGASRCSSGCGQQHNQCQSVDRQLLMCGTVTQCMEQCSSV